MNIKFVLRPYKGRDARSLLQQIPGQKDLDFERD